MSDSSVVVPPGAHGAGIVTFDRGGHHGYGHHGSHGSERVRGDLSISNQFRGQEIRDVLACAEQNGVRALVATKDLNLSLAVELGTMRKEMESLRGELRDRVRDDGDKTRDLIRDNEAKALAVQLADAKAEILRLQMLCAPSPAR